MADETTSPAGQAPASGETPPGTGSEQQPGQAPEEQFDPERARSLIAKLRQEAKEASRRLGEYETRQRQADEATMTEQQKLSRRAAQLEAELEAERADARSRANRYEVQLAAGRLGIVDPDAAVKLLDWDAIEYAEDGSPRDVEAALKALLKSKPYLAAQAAAPAASPTNPARQSSTASRTYTVSQLKDFRFYQANKDDIATAMREGRVLPG